jgi:hypothetical protein
LTKGVVRRTGGFAEPSIWARGLRYPARRSLPSPKMPVRKKGMAVERTWPERVVPTPERVIPAPIWAVRGWEIFELWPKIQLFNRYPWELVRVLPDLPLFGCSERSDDCKIAISAVDRWIIKAFCARYKPALRRIGFLGTPRGSELFAQDFKTGLIFVRPDIEDLTAPPHPSARDALLPRFLRRDQANRTFNHRPRCSSAATQHRREDKGCTYCSEQCHKYIRGRQILRGCPGLARVERELT